MKFTLRDEVGRILYIGILSNESFRPDWTLIIRLDEYKADPEIALPFFQLVIEPGQ